MNSQFLIDVMQESLWVALKISLPILLSSLVVGILISIFQTATQIQEATLTFIPKLLVMVVILFFFSSWILDTLNDYFIYILGNLDTWGTM
jgi:flagellar biosynthetic protein FliQ